MIEHRYFHSWCSVSVGVYEYMQFEIKIPLVKLSFASKAGLKRIPKKRPAERGTGEENILCVT